MITSFNLKTNNLGLVTLLIIMLGIMVRANVYIQNRSLIIDEANLARNIVERDYADLFRGFDHQQYAPPLFSFLTKTSTQLFGVNEYALRLPALLAGILSLLLLTMIVNLLIKEHPSRWYVLLLFSFSIMAIRYSSEFKQYSTDAAVTLFFIYWAIRSKDKKFNVLLTAQWAVIGAMAIWFSMPAIFVLASMGIAFLYHHRKQNKIISPHLFLLGAAWLLSFGVYFYLLLYKDAVTEGLVDYHSAYFFNFFPTDLASTTQSLNLLESLFRSATDKTVISIIWAIMTFIVGAVYLIKKNRFVAILLLSPIFLCLIASHLQFYSLIERLTLFMMPLLLVVMGIGISWLWSQSNVAIKVLLVAAMLISVVNKSGYQYLWSSLELEDSKSVMEYLSANRSPDELIYVQWDGVPAFVFYNDLYDKAWNYKNYYLANWSEEPSQVIPQVLNSTTDDKFWLFLSHTFPQEHIERQINSAKQIGKELDRYTSVQASTYYFQIE